MVSSVSSIFPATLGFIDESSVNSIILPVLGVVIILVILVFFILPCGNNFKDRTLKFKGFGMDMEVSVLALFVLMGVVLALTGNYIRITESEKNQLLQKSQERAAGLKEALDKANKMDIRMHCLLEGRSENNSPNLENLQCHVYLSGEKNPAEVEIDRRFSSDYITLTLRDITRRANVDTLVIEDASTKTRWTKEHFMPFEPIYTLKQKEAE